MSGAFQEAALAWHEAGCTVLPVSQEKKPCINGWNRWSGQSTKTVKDLMRKFPAANLGIATGKPITVVDVDDPAHVQPAIGRFGDTPVQIATQSGGRHLWYRSGGEGNHNLRPDLAVDIKGVGGQVVVPPSVGEKGEYRFVKGGLADLHRLPLIKADALPSKPATGKLKRFEKGRRNDDQFDYGREEAHHCDDFDALLDVLRTQNDNLPEPLEDAEVVKTANQIWKYKLAGTLFRPGGESRAVIRESLTDALLAQPHGPDLLALYTKLQHAHGARDEPFAIVTKAMQRAGTLPGWDHRKIQRAKDGLLKSGQLELVGGTGKLGDPYTFRFSK